MPSFAQSVSAEFGVALPATVVLETGTIRALANRVLAVLRLEQEARRLYIKKKILEKYGYTEDCEACRRMRAGIGQAGRAHTEKCRSRVENEMDKERE